MPIKLDRAHFGPNDPDNLNKLAEVAANILSRGMDILKIDGAFMVAMTDETGKVILLTDVEPGRIQEFAIYVTEHVPAAAAAQGTMQ